MWYEIMKGLNCKVTSTWLSCDCGREMAFKQAILGRMEKGGRRSWITSLGPRWHRIRCTYTTTSICGIHGTVIRFMLRYVKLTRKIFSLDRKGWRPVNDEAKIEFKKTVMNKEEEEQKEDLETMQKNIEEAAKRVAQTTKSERDKETRRAPEKVRIRDGASGKVYQ